MPYKFFDNLLDSKRERTKRKLTLPVSIGIHVVVLGAVLLVPLLTFSELPDPVMSSAIRAYLVEAAPAPPPPPPPPPPPAASAPKPVTQPKVEQPKPVVEEPKFTAPIETPKEIPHPEPATGLDSGPGEPGGEIGGIQEGPEVSTIRFADAASAEQDVADVDGRRQSKDADIRRRRKRVQPSAG